MDENKNTEWKVIPCPQCEGKGHYLGITPYEHASNGWAYTDVYCESCNGKGSVRTNILNLKEYPSK